MFLRKFRKNINDKLFDAFLSEDLDKIGKCVSGGANINNHFPRLNHGTLLHYSPTIEMMNGLLNLGADTDAKDLTGSTPLHVYVTVGKSELAMELIRLKADVNAKNSCGQSPLHLAVINNIEVKLVRELLKSGADVNGLDQDNNSPLNYAVKHCTNLEVSKALLEYGGNMRTRGDHSNFDLGPFEEAIMLGNVAHIQLFIKYTILKYGDFFPVSCLDCFTQNPNHVLMLGHMYECVIEVKEMKKDKIGTKSLYDIVVGKDVHIKPSSLNNKTKEYFQSKYTIYSDMILDKLQYWLVRAKLLRALEYISDFNTFSRVLNLDCIYQIVEYLPNDDLSNLIEAFVELERLD